MTSPHFLCRHGQNLLCGVLLLPRDHLGGLPLSEMLWAHPRIFGAYVSYLVPGLTITKDSFDQFFSGAELYDGELKKIGERNYIARWIVSGKVAKDTDWETLCDFVINNKTGTYLDPFHDQDLYYDAIKIEDAKWCLWDRDAYRRISNAWKDAYRSMIALLESGELIAQGRFQSALADLTEIPPHVWPDDAHSPLIDFQNGRLRLITQEEFFFVQLFASGDSQKALGTPSTTPKPSPKEASVLLALEGLGWRKGLPSHITAKTRNNSIHKWLLDNKHPTVSDNLIIQVIRKHGLKP